MVDTNDAAKVFAWVKLRIMFALSRRRLVIHQADKRLPVALRGGIERTPGVITGIKTYGRLEAVQGRHQIAQRIVPGAPLVAIEGLVVLGVDLAAEILPAMKRESELNF